MFEAAPTDDWAGKLPFLKIQVPLLAISSAYSKEEVIFKGCGTLKLCFWPIISILTKQKVSCNVLLHFLEYLDWLSLWSFCLRGLELFKTDYFCPAFHCLSDM